jgi:hypothetical protein
MGHQLDLLSPLYMSLRPCLPLWFKLLWVSAQCPHLVRIPQKKNVKPGRLFSVISGSWISMRDRLSFDEFAARVRWLSGAVKWATRFANHGFAWLPVRLRVIPLQFLAKIVQLHL